MAIQLTSSTQSETEMAEALQQAGRTVVPSGGEPGATAAAPPAPDPNNPSVPPVQPGESPRTTPEGGTAPASEAGEPKPQGETPAGEKPNEPKPGEKRDNFESRRVKLERKLDRVQDELELERGNKTKLQTEVESLKAQLAALQPPQAEPVKDAGPVKPKRPTMADCDFDTERFDVAMEAYDTANTAYIRDSLLKEVEDRQKQDREAEQKRKQEEAQAKSFSEFVARKEEGRAAIADWDAVFEELGDQPIDMPVAVEVAVLQSKNPAALLHFFAKDVLTNDAAEMQIIAKLDPVGQVRAIVELESRIKAESGTGGAPAPKPPKPAAAAPATAPPAPPKKPVAAVEPPIEPVGSRASATGPGLASANDPQAYFRLRHAGVNRP